MPTPTITRKQMLKAIRSNKAGIMRASWLRRTNKKGPDGTIIEPAGTRRDMRFVTYKDGPKKHWEPAGGFFANAATAEDAKAIKRRHKLVVVYPVEGQKTVEEPQPRALPWSDVFEFQLMGKVYKVRDDDK